MVFFAQSEEPIADVAAQERSHNYLNVKLWREYLEERGIEIQGFFEGRAGFRTQDDPHISKTATLSETRLQLNVDWYPDPFECKLRVDFFGDGVTDDWTTEFREVNVFFSPDPLGAVSPRYCRLSAVF